MRGITYPVGKTSEEFLYRGGEVAAVTPLFSSAEHLLKPQFQLVCRLISKVMAIMLQGSTGSRDKENLPSLLLTSSPAKTSFNSERSFLIRLNGKIVG